MARRLALTILCVALLASPSAAIVSNPLPRICNEFRHSDYVFAGRVLSETNAWPRRLRGEGVTIYRIRVDGVFKGRVPRIARLYTANDSGRGVLTAGQLATVFARRYDGRMYFTGSSNSQSGAGATRVVADIRGYLLHPPTVTTISGRVDGNVRGGFGPLGGVRLLLTDGTAKRFVRADRHGKFLAAVPPGRWSVRIAEPGWASRSGVYSYDSAEKIQLRKGDCADLEVETAAPGERLEGLPPWKRWPK
jgi:hypothetical protein